MSREKLQDCVVSSCAIGRWIQRRKPFVAGVFQLGTHGIRVIRSRMFDGAWYLRQRPNLVGTKLPALCHYVWRGCIDDPSPDFCSQEYLHMNPDVARAEIPAVLHYQRYGRNAGRLISLLEVGREPEFPEQAESFTEVFTLYPRKHGRVAVFASYSGNGRIEPYVLHYLHGLREVCDNVVFVTDSPLFLEEKRKLRELVACMIVSRHGEYDFGSYKRGWDWLNSTGMLGNLDELVFCNDSCYGPFHPFLGVFEEMKARTCDFWGLTAFHTRDSVSGKLRFHIQSFFFVFKRLVLDSSVFNTFMGAIGQLPEPSRENVIAFYEFRLTQILEESGFKMDSLVSKELCLHLKGAPTYFGATIMARYGMPLMKIKTYGGMGHAESSRKVLRVAKRLNPALYADVVPHFNARLAAFKRHRRSVVHPKVSIKEHQASFQAKVETVRKRAGQGEQIRVSFLVSSEAMFSSWPIFTAMCADSLFKARIVVVPAEPLADSLPGIAMCMEKLKRALPEATVLSSCTENEVVPWLDISEDSDIVVYNSPYSASHFFYNPRFSVGRNFLPIHVNYGYYRSIYDRHIMRMDNYAYFWKALFENNDTLGEYRRYSVLKGANALLTGYCKMDPLAEKSRSGPADRKCILIAPHHSVDGGKNRVLALSNFVRYEKLIVSLPMLYPTIDFIFRAHPALFGVLSREELWGEEKTQAWCEALRSHPNVRWSDEADYLQDFADSDGIIQDCGSFLVEYFYTGKPCCYLLKSPKDISSKFTPFGADCLAHCYLAYEETMIVDFIDQIIVGENDPLAEERRQFASERIVLNYPYAADVALETIKREIEL